MDFSTRPSDSVAIPFFRKTSSEPASSGGSKPSAAPVKGDPHTSTLDFTQGDLRALAAAAGKIQVAEMSDADHPAVEEAAILFANHNDDMAAAVLEGALDGEDGGNETLWAMLFDLYRVTGQREPFEQRGVAFASRFGRSPPIWSEGPEQSPATSHKPTSTAGPSVTLSGTLDARVGAQLDQIAKVALKAGKLKIDFARLRAADNEGCEHLVALLHELRRGRVRVSFANARNMLPMVEGAAQAGRREAQGTWLMVLELLQALGEQQRFEDVALDYAITFEESPPSYEPPPAEAALAASTPAAPAATPLELVPIEEEATRFAFEGEVSSAQAEALRKLARFAADRTTVEIDASKLTRMDFVSAGNLFNALTQLQGQGKLTIIRGLNAMVAALLRVMGVQHVATMELRRN